MKVCSKCKFENSDSKTWCDKCGTLLLIGQPVASSSQKARGSQVGSDDDARPWCVESVCFYAWTDALLTLALAGAIAGEVVRMPGGNEIGLWLIGATVRAAVAYGLWTRNPGAQRNMILLAALGLVHGIQAFSPKGDQVLGTISIVTCLLIIAFLKLTSAEQYFDPAKATGGSSPGDSNRSLGLCLGIGLAVCPYVAVLLKVV